MGGVGPLRDAAGEHDENDDVDDGGARTGEAGTACRADEDSRQPGSPDDAVIDEARLRQEPPVRGREMPDDDPQCHPGRHRFDPEPAGEDDDHQQNPEE